MRLVRIWAMATTLLAVFLLVFAMFQPFRTLPREKQLYAMLANAEAGGEMNYSIVQAFTSSCKRPWNVVVLAAALLLTLNVLMEWLMRQRMVNPQSPGSDSRPGESPEPFKLFGKRRPPGSRPLSGQEPTVDDTGRHAPLK